MSGTQLYGELKGYRVMVCFGCDTEGRPNGSGCFNAFLVPEDTESHGQCERCGANGPIELGDFMIWARDLMEKAEADQEHA